MFYAASPVKLMYIFEGSNSNAIKNYHVARVVCYHLLQHLSDLNKHICVTVRRGCPSICPNGVQR